jgi:transposase
MSLSTVAPAAPSHDATMVVAFELSKAKWKVGIVLPQSTKLSRYTIAGGDTGALAELLATSRQKAERRCGMPVRVVSCYEAGYDGFWLHRWLADHDVTNHVLDPASIEVNRRARRAKTDRIDLEKLMRVQLAHLRGEPKVCSVVRVPSVEDEDAKRRTRERERLTRERGGHVNRIKALLHGQGIRDVKPTAKRLLALLATVRTGDGRQVPPALAAEIAREHARLCLVDEQLKAVARETSEVLQTAPAGSTAAKALLLMALNGIDKSALVLANEVFYRRFRNRREVGGYTGLTGTPYDSGETQREQGISKAGNRRVRTLAIEIAWLWLRHQSRSELSQWFHKRVGQQKGRVRKIAIVALARKLMVALWRYVEFGIVPRGALLAAAPARR